MPYKCAALNCRTNCNPNDGTKEENHISMHVFPLEDPDRLRQWVQRLHRKNFTPTKYSRICSLHFKSDDFEKESTDKNIARKRKRFDSRQKAKRTLKSTAVPSIFTGLPSYLTSNVCNERPTKHATTSARNEIMQTRFQKLEVDLDESEKVTSVSDLLSKLLNERLPDGFFVHHTTDQVTLFYMDFSITPAEHRGTIVIHENLSCDLYNGKIQLCRKRFSHLVKNGQLMRTTDVCNLMAFLKNDIFSNGTTCVPKDELIQHIVSSLTVSTITLVCISLY